jgi:uncharacterized membrane protein
MASWKRDFASGLIVLAPLIVTVLFLAWLYSYIARVPVPVDSGPVRVALTVVILILLVFSVGYLMRTAVGAVLETALDDLMNRLPGLRVIYNASKMAVETAVGGTSELQSPVRLEVWNGLRMTAFKTGAKAPDGREILFLPTAPNITTGFVIEVEPDRYQEIDDSVEDALTRILSAGFGEANGDTVAALVGDDIIPDDQEEVAIDEVSDSSGDADETTEPTSADTADATAAGPGDDAPATESEPSTVDTSTEPDASN